MGGSSKSEQHTDYTTINSSLEGENAVNVIDSAGVEVVVTDHGAIADALGFAEDFGVQALDFADDGSKRAFGFAEDANKRSFGFAEDALDSNERALDKSFAHASKAYGGASDLIGKQVAAIKELATNLKIGDQTGSRWLMFAALIAVVVVVVAYMIWG